MRARVIFFSLYLFFFYLARRCNRKINKNEGMDERKNKWTKKTNGKKKGRFDKWIFFYFRERYTSERKMEIREREQQIDFEEFSRCTMVKAMYVYMRACIRARTCVCVCVCVPLATSSRWNWSWSRSRSRTLASRCYALGNAISIRVLFRTGDALERENDAWWMCCRECHSHQCEIASQILSLSYTLFFNFSIKKNILLYISI